MFGRLEGKTALVTAAGQGIGKATAELMANEGARVIATDINLETLERVEKCEHEYLNVLELASINDVADKIGSVDILFNCAGIVHNGSIMECSEDDWDLACELNIKSMYRMVKTFLPSMLEKQAGSIVNMSSVVSSLKGAPNRFAYGMSKAGVIGLTKAIAADFVTEGIRCNAICPGTVQSPSLDERLAATGNYDKARKEFVARQPMGRLGKTEEIAEMAVYLASDAASFTTGQCFVIDGGWAI